MMLPDYVQTPPSDSSSTCHYTSARPVTASSSSASAGANYCESSPKSGYLSRLLSDEHIKKYMAIPTAQRIKLRCRNPQCPRDMLFKSYRELAAHMDTHPQFKPPFFCDGKHHYCDNCPFSVLGFTSESEKRDHKNHRQCGFCGKVFSRVDNLKTHNTAKPGKLSPCAKKLIASRAKQASSNGSVVKKSSTSQNSSPKREYRQRQHSQGLVHEFESYESQKFELQKFESQKSNTTVLSVSPVSDALTLIMPSLSKAELSSPHFPSPPSQYSVLPDMASFNFKNKYGLQEFQESQYSFNESSPQLFDPMLKYDSSLGPHMYMSPAQLGANPHYFEPWNPVIDSDADLNSGIVLLDESSSECSEFSNNYNTIIKEEPSLNRFEHSVSYNPKDVDWSKI